MAADRPVGRPQDDQEATRARARATAPERPESAPREVAATVTRPEDVRRAKGPETR